MSRDKDKVTVLKGTGIGPLISVEEGRKRLDDYMRDHPEPSDPTDHEALCREVREMLGDTPEEAECGCKKEDK
ncbi:MAG: hypothetical protein DI537_41255 [Stutzerimonas stutzeri]|nr:MAG: hypothetical protein DI537_41255 [Stutzerimonas stutzeri]